MLVQYASWWGWIYHSAWQDDGQGTWCTDGHPSLATCFNSKVAGRKGSLRRGMGEDHQWPRCRQHADIDTPVALELTKVDLNWCEDVVAHSFGDDLRPSTHRGRSWDAETPRKMRLIMIQFWRGLYMDDLFDGSIDKCWWYVEAHHNSLMDSWCQEQGPQWGWQWRCAKGLDSWVADALGEAFGNDAALQWSSFSFWFAADHPLCVDDFLELF